MALCSATRTAPSLILSLCAASCTERPSIDSERKRSRWRSPNLSSIRLISNLATLSSLPPTLNTSFISSIGTWVDRPRLRRASISLLRVIVMIHDPIGRSGSHVCRLRCKAISTSCTTSSASLPSNPIRAVPPRDPSQNRGQGLEKASVSRSVSPNRRAHKFCQVFLSVRQSQGLVLFSLHAVETLLRSNSKRPFVCRAQCVQSSFVTLRAKMTNNESQHFSGSTIAAAAVASRRSSTEEGSNAMAVALSGLGRLLAGFFTEPAHVHGAAPKSRPEQLLAYLQPADVLLVESHSRVSVAINTVAVHLVPCGALCRLLFGRDRWRSGALLCRGGCDRGRAKRERRYVRWSTHAHLPPDRIERRRSPCGDAPRDKAARSTL